MQGRNGDADEENEIVDTAGSHSLLQGIFPTQGLNPGLQNCRWILYQLSHKGSPGKGEGRRNTESGIDIYTLLYVKQITSGKLLYNMWSPPQCLVIAWRGGKGGGEG